VPIAQDSQINSLNQHVENRQLGRPMKPQDDIRNKILLGIPTQEANILFPKLTLVEFQVGTVLNPE
jgi:hypothetical protein